MNREILYTVKCLPGLCNDTIQGWLSSMKEAQDYRDYQSEKRRIVSEMNSFENKVNAILNDQSGWSRCGVKFTQVDKLGFRNDYIIGKKINDDVEVKVKVKQYGGRLSEYVEILLCPSHVISNNYCPVLDNDQRLSCADMRKKKVYVNLERWLFGSDFGIEQIPLEEYQKYLVNHEIGHAVFGLLHPECNELIGYDKAPVMLQQTINLCNKLYFNPYPLEEEVIIFK